MANAAQPGRARALAAAVRQGLLDLPKTIEDKPLAFFYDWDAWDANLACVRSAFGSHWLHACAVKTNPLVKVLQRAKHHGHGAECASISEVVHSLNVGFAPKDIIFDSPSKTIPEVIYALEKGVHLNIDNVDELARVEQVVSENSSIRDSLNGSSTTRTGSNVGLRINPLVGAGTIAAFSVSTGKSKFGVPLYKDESYRANLVEKIVAASYINCIHVHTGSGGMGLVQMVDGARTAVDFAKAINEKAGMQQIQVIDIGGGLSSNFKDDTIDPTFDEYAKALKQRVPELFNSNEFMRVVTEFGAACQFKFGWMASRVEYVKQHEGGRIALIHAGSDIFARACYCPSMFVDHRVFPFDVHGIPKECQNDDDLITHDIAGPLCFSGDVVVKDVKLPSLSEGDLVMLVDCGGNTLSIHTTHCSRQMPAVYGYSVDQEGNVVFELIKEQQSISGAIGLW